MIPRYADTRIAAIWSDEAKLARWDEVELAVLGARSLLGVLPEADCDTIRCALAGHPPDIKWWLERENVVRHDLVAYIDERRRHLPLDLQYRFHEHMTSFDTEEAAFARALGDSCAVIAQGLLNTFSTLHTLAHRYRFTPLLDRTHGQWAKLRTFGGRVLTWYQELALAQQGFLESIESGCRISRLSGAIGNYGGGLTPEIEERALSILGLTPLLGATQILPRVVYAPVAQNLRLIAEVLGKIALDIRLGARSGSPLYHEPFSREQTGSSAMPHKKNTILTEQMEGMVRMVRGRESAIVSNIPTWESRAIEQSCVERVDWPDIFHLVMRMIIVMNRVLDGLVVYPATMLREIIASCGTYASDEAKNFLAEQLSRRGIEADVAYRIVQHASFCAFELSARGSSLFPEAFQSLEQANAAMTHLSQETSFQLHTTIKELIASGTLCCVHGQSVSDNTLLQWNILLQEIFSDSAIMGEWEKNFSVQHLLKQEEYLFTAILGKT